MESSDALKELYTETKWEKFQDTQAASTFENQLMSSTMSTD